MTRAIFAAVLLWLAGCGGGGGGGSPGASGPVVPAPPLRRDLHYAYYGGCRDHILEQAGHVTAWWATGWCGTGLSWHADVALELAMARAAGVRGIVLALPHGLVWQPGAREEVRAQLMGLQQSGELAGWDSIMVYPADEPDIRENGRRSDAEVLAMLGWLRAELRAIPALSGSPVGVIYSCSSGGRPGISGYDVVGCDHYESGCAIVGVWRELLSELRPDQRLVLPVGGAEPWRVDPACVEFYAHGEPRVWGIVPFLWQDHAAPGVGLGIRSNGMRRLYCEAGRKILAGSAEGCA